ncbi:uncharacterized protein LOC124888977 [Capsicum annuum]|uniref:uncharacterized protein LOC124888977 n=1 Tax=Capsicum annuum TaxID=4072 RepID=UPI001FB098E5|nr:uncharacterized protein LOC124888977 [Capsicum annuum]
MAFKSAKEIWDYLKEEYTGDERIRIKVLNLIRKFELQKMEESETVKEYSDRLFGIINKVRLLGTKFKDSKIVERILVTVPERYDVSIITLENTKDLSKITLAELLNTLQAQEQRRLMRQDGMVEGALAANHKTQSKGNNSRKNYPHFQHYGKIGHPPFKCWKRPDAQCKICHQLGHEAKIRIANGNYIPVEGKGNVAIKTVSGTKIISNVLYVPDIDKSLLSVGQLMEEGFKLLFGDNYCRIFDSTNLEILQIDIRGKSFLFNPTEDAHKSCKNKDELADLFKMSNSAEVETISDPRRSVTKRLEGSALELNVV